MLKIALVTGHSNSRGGAVGNMGISEFDFNNKLIKEIMSRLRLSDGIEARQFFRTVDRKSYTEKMKNMHKRIDRFGAKYSISFHFNAALSSTANGHEILYCSKKGKQLATKLDKKFDQYLDNRDRRIKKRTKRERGGGFLCNGKSTCILIEPFFASRQHLYIEGGEERENLIESIVEFIREL